MIKDKSDKTIIKEITNGNYSVFKDIYNKYSKEMYCYALKILDNKEVCEDLIQNIFIDIWSKKENLRIEKLKPYLFRCVKYQVFNHIRNKKVSNEDLTRLNLIDVSMNASQKMEYTELEEVIKRIIEFELPERCQEIFKLSRFEHKSNQEIALELGITIQAVKNQISKGIQKIRMNLQSEEMILYFTLFYFSIH